MLSIGPRSRRFLGLWGGLTSLIRILPSDTGLSGILVRASIDLVVLRDPVAVSPWYYFDSSSF
jgi:hypothetical protein